MINIFLIISQLFQEIAHVPHTLVMQLLLHINGLTNIFFYIEVFNDFLADIYFLSTDIAHFCVSSYLRDYIITIQHNSKCFSLK